MMSEKANVLSVQINKFSLAAEVKMNLLGREQCLSVHFT